MFDLGISKMVMIGVVALIVIGPERLPRVARTVGALLGKAQRYVNEVKREVNQAMELDELRKVKTSVEEAARDLEHSVRTHASDFQKEVDTISQDLHDLQSWEEGSMQQSDAAMPAPDDGLEDASKRAFVTAVAPVSAPVAQELALAPPGRAAVVQGAPTGAPPPALQRRARQCRLGGSGRWRQILPQCAQALVSPDRQSRPQAMRHGHAAASLPPWLPHPTTTTNSQAPSSPLSST